MQVGDSQSDMYVHSLMEQCKLGLRSVLAALDNYSLAFEAIRGMRGELLRMMLCWICRKTDFLSDQVRDAVNCFPGFIA